MFGVTNVAIHHVAIAVELGDAGTALDHAKHIDASRLGRERRARLAIDIARACEHARKHERALAALLTAEKLAELKDVPGFAAVFLPDSKPPQAGTTLKQTALAATLDATPGRCGI